LAIVASAVNGGFPEVSAKTTIFPSCMSGVRILSPAVSDDKFYDDKIIRHQNKPSRTVLARQSAASPRSESDE